MILVVDASVALKWFLHVHDREPDGERALAILAHVDDESIELVQPAHFVAEVAAVLAREKPNTAEDDLLDLLHIERSTIDTPQTYARALELSMRYEHHLFDTLYHAAALQIPGAKLVTADRRYFDKASGEGQIVLLANWSSE